MDFEGGAQLYVPVLSTEASNCMTTQYEGWWKVAFNEYLPRGLEILATEDASQQQLGNSKLGVPPVRKESSKPGIPLVRGKKGAVELNPCVRKKQSDREQVALSVLDVSKEPIVRSSSSTESEEPSLKRKREDVALPPSVSSASTTARLQRRYAIGIWEEIKDLVSRTPLSESGEIVAEVKALSVHFEALSEVDTSSIRALVSKYLDVASAAACSVSDVAKASSEYGAEIKSAECELAKLREHMKSSVARREHLQEQLSRTVAYLRALREELSTCAAKEESLRASLEECEGDLDQTEAEVANLCEAKECLQQAKDECDASKKLLGLRQEILDFSWSG